MVNIILQIISMVLCLVGILQVRVVPKSYNAYYRHYFGFFVVLIVYSSAILTGLTLSGKEGAAVRAVIIAAVFVEFLAGYSLTFQVINMLLVRVTNEENKRQIKILRTVQAVCFIVQATLLTISQFTDLYYSIDSSNIFHRRDGYLIHFIIWVAEYLLGVCVLIRYRGCLKRTSLASFSLFAAFFGVASVLQIVFPGVYFVTVASSFSIVVLFAFVASDNSEEYYRNKRELEKLKVDIMLSQIQPHYLFNSLTTIKYLCRHDPTTAEKALTDFSVFLRGNMDSINSDTPIPFAKELEHTKAYLALEELRFGDALIIEYAIESDSFLIPALTLQPIVENAVRHGIRETPEGSGVVRIASTELDDRYEITVADDGCGFDVRRSSESERKQIGIENVRYRLKTICNGTLTIDSETGKGTTAVITIFKR